MKKLMTMERIVCVVMILFWGYIMIQATLDSSQMAACLKKKGFPQYVGREIKCSSVIPADHPYRKLHQTKGE